MADSGTDKKVQKVNLLKGLVPENGWIPAGETWTYASATTFTISGDKTEKYQKGDKIKFTQTDVKYFRIVDISYTSPNTTITVNGMNLYTVANAGITSPFYSKMENPQGFPSSLRSACHINRNGVIGITIDAAYSDYKVYPFDTTFTNIGDGLVRDGSAIKILKPCSAIRVQAGLNLDLLSGENVQIQLRKNSNVQFLYDSGVASTGMLSIFTPSILLSAQKNDLITMAFSCSVARTFSTRGERSALIVEIIN